MPARAAWYAREPCTSSAELVCWVPEIVRMNAPSAARITSRKMAVTSKKPD
jgi:hypothetical protein